MRLNRHIFPRIAVLVAVALATTSLGAGSLRYTRLLSNDVLRAVRGASTAAGWEARQRSAVTLESLVMTRPVTVGLDPDSDDGDTRRTDGLAAGLRVWQDVLPDSPFRLANGDEQPDVLVKFVKDIPDGGDLAGEIEAGRRIQWGRNSRHYTLTATMLVRTHAEGRRLSKGEVTEVVAHELGHLLGLEDDEKETGLMGPFIPGKPRPYVSDEELRTVLEARDEMRAKIAELSRSK